MTETPPAAQLLTMLALELMNKFAKWAMLQTPEKIERIMSEQPDPLLAEKDDAIAGMAVAIKEQYEQIAAKDALLAEAMEALRGVIRVADRKTVEFDAARAILSKYNGGAR